MKNIVLIPYRNREEHLNYWIENTYPKLNKVLENLEVLVVEQSKDGKLFNRGQILNVGFKYYNKDEYNYFTHDVDMNPIQNNIINSYNENVSDNHISGIYVPSCNTLGGIIKFKGSTFKKINGFTNNYWGWGSEDKNLQNRAEYFKIKITKNILHNNPKTLEYFKEFNDINDRKVKYNRNRTIFEYHIFKKLSNSKKLKSIMSSGLNNLEYKIIKEENIKENIKKIIVDIPNSINGKIDLTIKYKILIYKFKKVIVKLRQFCKM